MGDVTEDPLTAVRDLHVPDASLYPRCEGCDSEGYESEPPDWPCRTARLVYTPDEIDARLAEVRALEESRRAALPKRTGEPSLIPQVWSDRLLAQAEAAGMFQRFLTIDAAPGSTGTFQRVDRLGREG